MSAGKVKRKTTITNLRAKIAKMDAQHRKAFERIEAIDKKIQGLESRKYRIQEQARKHDASWLRGFLSHAEAVQAESMGVLDDYMVYKVEGVWNRIIFDDNIEVSGLVPL